MNLTPELIAGLSQALRRRGCSHRLLNEGPCTCGDHRPPLMRPHARAARRSRKGGQLRRVFNRYGNRCYLCAETASTIEHVVPRSRGGRSTIENLRPACERCNGAKAAMSLEAFLDFAPAIGISLRKDLDVGLL